MKRIKTWLRVAQALLLAAAVVPCVAADLAEIKSRGEIRHLGINYANFVTGGGDGFDIEPVQGFAPHRRALQACADRLLQRHPRPAGQRCRA